MLDHRHPEINKIKSFLDKNLFHGHTAKQSSQPYILLPILFGCRGIWLLCSIVRYEMHFLASILYLSIKASVGQIFIHFLQLPQLSFSLISSAINISKNISDKNNHDP